MHLVFVHYITPGRGQQRRGRESFQAAVRTILFITWNLDVGLKKTPDPLVIALQSPAAFIKDHPGRRGPNASHAQSANR